MKSLRRVWDRSLPPPVAEAGRRSVGNRKEQQNAATMRVPRVGSPTSSYLSKKNQNRTEAEGDAFGSVFCNKCFCITGVLEEMDWYILI